MESNLTVYPMRFLPGMELKSSLLQFAKDKNLSAPFIMTCCGSVSKATLRMAKDPSNPTDLEIKTFNEHFEILSLVGTLSRDRGHLHISLGNKDGRVLGGHVVGDLIIHTTAEVVIGNCKQLAFDRKHDDATGFPELHISQKS